MKIGDTVTVYPYMDVNDGQAMTGTVVYYRADDTGSGVSGAHIDLCVASHEEAVQKGVRTATAYIIAPKENPT